MEKKFIWDEVEYNIEALTIRGAKEYFAVNEQIGKTENQMEQMDMCERALVALNCPEDIITTLPLDRFQECMEALGAVHWGTGGGDEGNAGGDELNH